MFCDNQVEEMNIFSQSGITTRGISPVGTATHSSVVRGEKLSIALASMSVCGQQISILAICGQQISIFSLKATNINMCREEISFNIQSIGKPCDMYKVLKIIDTDNCNL